MGLPLIIWAPVLVAVIAVRTVVLASSRARAVRSEALPLLLRTTGAQLGGAEAGLPLLAGSPVCVIHVLIFDFSTTCLGS